MVKSNSIFRRAEPTEPRLPIDLPCLLHLDGGPLSADVYNISYRGMAVRLEAEKNTFDLKTLTGILVPAIGEFLVLARWRKAGSLGFSFTNKRTVRPLLDAYFAQIGRYPD